MLICIAYGPLIIFMCNHWVSDVCVGSLPTLIRARTMCTFACIVNARARRGNRRNCRTGQEPANNGQRPSYIYNVANALAHTSNMHANWAVIMSSGADYACKIVNESLGACSTYILIHYIFHHASSIIMRMTHSHWPCKCISVSQCLTG